MKITDEHLILAGLICLGLLFMAILVVIAIEDMAKVSGV